jgi:hypothetical protein
MTAEEQIRYSGHHLGHSKNKYFIAGSKVVISSEFVEFA